jgi:hypothetical protein
LIDSDDCIFTFSFSSQRRFCDFCYEKFIKESLMSNYTVLDDPDTDTETKTNDDLKFEVRSERLIPTTDNLPVPAEE